jgi:hypothetical protein
MKSERLTRGFKEEDMVQITEGMFWIFIVSISLGIAGFIIAVFALFGLITHEKWHREIRR